MLPPRRLTHYMADHATHPSTIAVGDRATRAAAVEAFRHRPEFLAADEGSIYSLTGKARGAWEHTPPTT
jgi:hypothetical protein